MLRLPNRVLACLVVLVMCLRVLYSGLRRLTIYVDGGLRLMWVGCHLYQGASSDRERRGIGEGIS